VVSSPGGEPRSEGTGDARAYGEESEWVRSFLLTQPGKTYRLDATDEAHEEAARESLAVAARILTDGVVRGTDFRGTDDTQVPGEPS
jgi:hypothetical protein